MQGFTAGVYAVAGARCRPGMSAATSQLLLTGVGVQEDVQHPHAVPSGPWPLGAGWQQQQLREGGLVPHALAPHALCKVGQSVRNAPAALEPRHSVVELRQEEKEEASQARRHSQEAAAASTAGCDVDLCTHRTAALRRLSLGREAHLSNVVGEQRVPAWRAPHDAGAVCCTGMGKEGQL